MSARGMPHARLDVHVGPGSTHYLFCGVSGAIFFVSWLGRPVRSLGFWRPPAKHRPIERPRLVAWPHYGLFAHNSSLRASFPAGERTIDARRFIICHRQQPLSPLPSSAMSRRLFRIGRSVTGLGLFAIRPIKKRKKITEYKGRRVNAKEAVRLERRGNRYLYEINPRVTIDGS